MNTPTPIQSTQSYLGLQFGYIIIPKDVDRDHFIQQCYRSERVSILIDNGGGVVHDCYINRDALKNVIFPASAEKLGSCVIFITDAHSGHPVVFGVLSKEDESQLLREGFFKLIKEFNGCVVGVTGDAKTGVLNLMVTGGTLTRLNILVSNADKNALINVQCRGDVTLELDGTLQLKDKALKINEGSQPMVLGNELKTQLDKSNNLVQALINIINGPAIPEPSSGSPSALQAALHAAIATLQLGDYTHIKSGESTLD
jgi:hypothetical protein